MIALIPEAERTGRQAAAEREAAGERGHAAAPALVEVVLRRGCVRR